MRGVDSITCEERVATVNSGFELTVGSSTSSHNVLGDANTWSLEGHSFGVFNHFLRDGIGGSGRDYDILSGG